MTKIPAFVGALLFSISALAGTLGFVEQKFTFISFEKGKWDRSSTTQLPCFSYAATEDGSTVDVLRYGTSNLVPFKATKGLKVTICGSTAAFEEGFEAVAPILSTPVQKSKP